MNLCELEPGWAFEEREVWLPEDLNDPVPGREEVSDWAFPELAGLFSFGSFLRQNSGNDCCLLG